MGKQKKKTISQPFIPLFLLASSLFLVLIFILRSAIPSETLCANSLSCIHGLSGTYDPTQNMGEIFGKKISVPKNILPTPSPVLGIQTTSKDKKIFINLSTQHLYAYEGEKLIFEFLISSGKFNPTPVGEFKIWTKLFATHMEGGNKEKGTYYNLPNVPYTMYFYNENIGKWEGYGIHGAYWQNTFGYPSTFGCIGMAIDDVKRLFYWTSPFPSNSATFATEKDPGTSVIIFGKAPI